jgi:UPF0271 protein
MARDAEVEAVDGSVIQLRADTICVHGDTRGAAQLAKKIRTGLEQAQLSVIALSTTL